MDQFPNWAVRRLPAEFDLLAPDGSQIRLLSSGNCGSMVHCTLPPGATTRAIRHRTVEELWYCLSGTGEVWRQGALPDEVAILNPGAGLLIPVATPFQFRNTGQENFCLLIVTMPPWPGEFEAEFVPGRWNS